MHRIGGSNSGIVPLPSQCFVPGSRSCCCKAFSAGWNLVAALSRTGGRLHCPALLQSRLLVWGASLNSSETTFAGLNYHQLLIANQTGVPQTITKYWTIQIRDKRQGRESQADWDKIPTFAVCLNASPKPILCALPLFRTKLWANSQILCPNVQMSKASEMYDVPLSTWQGAAQSEDEYLAARGEFCFQWIFPEPELTGQLSPRCVSCFRTPSCSTCSIMLNFF